MRWYISYRDGLYPFKLDVEPPCPLKTLLFAESVKPEIKRFLAKLESDEPTLMTRNTAALAEGFVFEYEAMFRKVDRKERILLIYSEEPGKTLQEFNNLIDRLEVV